MDNTNNNDFSNQPVNTEQYHATSNLNTAMENPQVNINSAMGVNIQSATNQNFDDRPNYDFASTVPDNFTSFDNNQNFQSNLDNQTVNQFIPNTSVQSTESNYSYDDKSSHLDEETSYEPVMENNKGNSSKFKISRELKIVIFIVFILVIFILIMPYIYDFFKDLELIITG